MIRVDSWDRLRQLLLPIRLRMSRTIMLILRVISEDTASMASAAFGWAASLVKQLAYTSQVQAMEELVNDMFDSRLRRIRFIDGSEGEVLLFGQEQPHIVVASADDVQHRVVVVPTVQTNVGCDFIVEIPQGIFEGEKKVGALLRRYVFLGVNFEIHIIE